MGTGVETEQIRPCAALLRLRPGSVTTDLVRSIIGDGKAASYSELAREFGVAANTIKQSWRPAGMPGEQGNYSLAEILAWRLNYETTLSNGANRFESLADKELARREKEEEVRKLQLQADRLEREEEIAKGNLVNRADVTRALSAIGATLTESLLGLPDKLTPRLPEHMAVECTETLRGDIERFLKRFSESASDAVARLTE